MLPSTDKISILFILCILRKRTFHMETWLSILALTAVHGSLQTQQQVGESGLTGPGQVAVQVAALLPQVQLAGFGQ